MVVKSYLCGMKIACGQAVQERAEVLKCEGLAVENIICVSGVESHLLCHCVPESSISADINRLNKIHYNGQLSPGANVDTVELVAEMRMLAKVSMNIPLHKTLQEYEYTDWQIAPAQV